MSRNQTKLQLHRGEEGKQTALWNLSAEPEREKCPTYLGKGYRITSQLSSNTWFQISRMKNKTKTTKQTPTNQQKELDATTAAKYFLS